MRARDTQEDDGGRKNFLGRGNDGFQCFVCHAEVLPLVSGGFRSHCPACLWSRHVDIVPGDRRSPCGGLMRPARAEQRHGEWAVVHVCEDCGFERRNRLALADARQPDEWDRVVEISGG